MLLWDGLRSPRPHIKKCCCTCVCAQTKVHHTITNTLGRELLANFTVSVYECVCVCDIKPVTLVLSRPQEHYLWTVTDPHTMLKSTIAEKAFSKVNFWLWSFAWSKCEFFTTSCTDSWLRMVSILFSFNFLPFHWMKFRLIFESVS